MDIVSRYIEDNRERFLEELFIMLRQPSISTRNEGVKECAELLAAHMKKLGIDTRIYETPGQPMVYGEILRDSGSTVLIYGHYDVQPPEPLEEWLSPPFEPTVRQGKIFARGSSDNKGQFYCYLKAVEAFQKTIGEVPVSLKFLFEGEEETGSPHLKPFAETHRGLLKADMTIFSDSHIHESGRPLLILGLKGLLYVELKVRGVLSDQHSGRASSLPSAAWRLVWALATLRNRHYRVTIPGFYDEVRELTELEKEAVARIPCDEGKLLEYYGIEEFIPGRFSTDYYFNLVSEPTCNISGMGSGYTGTGNQNVLPAKASAKLDFRLVPDQRPDDILEKLKRHLVSQGFSDIEVIKRFSTDSSRTPIDHPGVEMIKDALREVYTLEPIVFPSIGASGPNFVFTEVLRQPCFLVPFASIDQCNHGPNENMDIEGFFKGIRVAMRLMQKASGGRGG
jgi:acetylornithine deacetylase/succinyl-diaminopimelate desuccinylase-like protein